MSITELKARCARALANRMGAGQPHRTYVIGPSGKAILCLVCHKISHHPMDVANLYCGHCHRFHEPGLPPAPTPEDAP